MMDMKIYETSPFTNELGWQIVLMTGCREWGSHSLIWSNLTRRVIESIKSVYLPWPALISSWLHARRLFLRILLETLRVWNEAYTLFKIYHKLHLPWPALVSSSLHARPLFLRILLTDDTEGMEWGSHTLALRSLSRISHANIPGFSCLRRRIFFTTVGVATCCGRKGGVRLFSEYVRSTIILYLVGNGLL